MSTLATWDKILGALGSTGTSFGGEWGNLISDFFNGFNIGLTDPTKLPRINTLTRFKQEKLGLFDGDESHEVVFSVDDIDTGPNRKIKIRRMINPFETDYMLFEGLPAAILNKDIDSTLNNITNIVNADIKSDAAIDYTKLALTNTIQTADLVDNAITQPKMADNSVGTAEIIDANVTLAKLASNSVDTSKIIDANVTLSKLAGNSVDSSKIVDGAIVNVDINASAGIVYSKLSLNNSIVATDLTSDSVITTKILDANVTLAKLAANSVDSSKIVDDSIVNADINSTAAIAYSKLSLNNSIVSNDVVSLAWAKLTGIPTTFAPSPHNTSHKLGGSDVLLLDELGAPTDVTTLNATPTAHGLLKKLSNVAGEYFDGTGNWSIPAGTGGGGGGAGQFGGMALKSGNSSDTVFTIPHNLSYTPTGAIAVASSIDALGSFITDVDDTNVIITYQIAPPTGTDNLEFIWVIADTNGTNMINTTNTATISNKTLNSVNNIFKNLGSYNYEVFKDGSNWIARNTRTGVITSTNTNLTTVLQAAINALTGSRDWKESIKVFGDGEFGQILIPSYTRLDFTDFRLTVTTNTNKSVLTNTATPYHVTNNPTLAPAATEIEIVGGMFDGNRFNNSDTSSVDQDKNLIYLENVTRATIVNPYIIRPINDGIRFRSCTDTIVYKPYIEDSRSEGLSIVNSSHVTVMNPHIKNTGWSFMTTKNSPNTQFIGGRCETNGILGGVTSGINISSKDSYAFGITVIDTTNSGFTLGDNASSVEFDPSGSAIENCTIKNTDGPGIRCNTYPARDIKITTCTIKDSLDRGIALGTNIEDFVVSDNIIDGCETTGILVNGSTASGICRRIEITNNIISNCGKSGDANNHLRSAIALYGNDVDTVENIICEHNICYDNQGVKTQKYGVMLRNTNKVQMRFNSLYDNLTDGYLLADTNNNPEVIGNLGHSAENRLVGTRQVNTITGAVNSPIIFRKIAASGQDSVVRFDVSDDTGSYLEVLNATGSDNAFIPSWLCVNSAALTAGLFIGQGTTDTGTQPLFIIRSRIGSGTAVATRPLFAIENAAGTDRPMVWNPNSVTFRDTYNIAFSTTTGTKIGTSTTQKLAFWNAPPVVQRSAIASPTADVNSLKTAVDLIRTALIDLGLTA